MLAAGFWIEGFPPLKVSTFRQTTRRLCKLIEGKFLPKHEGSVCGRCVPLSCTLFFFWAFGGVSSIYAVSVSKRTADKLKLLPEDIEWRLGGGLFFDGNTVVKRHWLIWYRIEGRAFMTMCGKWASGKKIPPPRFAFKSTTTRDKRALSRSFACEISPPLLD